MGKYELELEDVPFDNPAMDVLNDAWSEFDRFESRPEPVPPSISDLVDLFIEYRKRVKRRGSSRKMKRE